VCERVGVCLNERVCWEHVLGFSRSYLRPSCSDVVAVVALEELHFEVVAVVALVELHTATERMKRELRKERKSRAHYVQ
jgi:hypothetical protein